MGKSQSKSYDLSSGSSEQKANHRRPKSSQNRESLLLARNSQNINGNTDNQLDKQVQPKVENSTANNQVEPKVNGVSESHDTQPTESGENLNSKGDNSENLTDKNEKEKENSDDYNPQEESDQIDKALEEYIHSHKEEDTKDESNEKLEEVSEEKKEESNDLKQEEEKIHENGKEEEKGTNLAEDDKEEDKKEVGEEIRKEEENNKEEENSKEEKNSKEEDSTNEEEKTKEEEISKEEETSKEEEVSKEEENSKDEEVSKEEEKEESVQIKPEVSETVEENISSQEVESVESVPEREVISKEVQEGEKKDSDSEEEVQENQIDLEAEPEDSVQVIEEKTETDSEQVQFKTVISLESTPPHSNQSQEETVTREEDPLTDTVSPSEPTVPVEEPTLPESATVVSSELSEEMSTVEAVVCGVNDLKDGEMKEVDVGDGKALLVKENGQFYAVGNKCTHYGAPLAKGALCNGRVRCPWHGACFNVKTGDIEDFPGLDSLPKFEVSVSDGKVKVKGNKEQLTSSKVQRSMCKHAADNQKSVLIIGGGPSSVMCAETLRKEGFTGKVTLATQEKCLPYDRVKLSKAMDSTPEGIALRAAEFYKNNDIDIQTNKRAVSVDTKAKSVSFEDGSSLSYTSLVLATGGKPRQLPIPGANFDNVCLLRTPEDANKIANAAKGKKVVIIGSSFIGMEVAAFLADKAESLSVVDIIKVPFQLVLGEKVGSVLQKLHEDQGVKFYFEKGIQEFTGSGNTATEAVLSDGTILPCDLAILGVGVVPATDFLKGSDINLTNRGFIPVDKNMKTNVDDVYATGDIVEFPLFTAGDQQVNVQHWQMAHAHGQAAAFGILGRNVDIKSVPFFWTMMYKKSIRYSGYGFGYDDIVVHGDLDAPNFIAFYAKGDEVVAVATLGADPVAAQVAEIMYNGQKILKSEIQDSTDVIAEKFAKL